VYYFFTTRCTKYRGEKIPRGLKKGASYNGCHTLRLEEKHRGKVLVGKIIIYQEQRGRKEGRNSGTRIGFLAFIL
jgi:hypothetical protein